MSKYYISCGTLKYIMSTNRKPFRAAIQSMKEVNEHDVLDEYFYIDERGFRDYSTAQPDTKVYEAENVMKQAGWRV